MRLHSGPSQAGGAHLSTRIVYRHMWNDGFKTHILIARAQHVWQWRPRYLNPKGLNGRAVLVGASALGHLVRHDALYFTKGAAAAEGYVEPWDFPRGAALADQTPEAAIGVAEDGGFMTFKLPVDLLDPSVAFGEKMRRVMSLEGTLACAKGEDGAVCVAKKDRAVPGVAVVEAAGKATVFVEEQQEAPEPLAGELDMQRGAEP